MIYAQRTVSIFQLKEKKRVEEAGGYVSLNGVWRVQGVLATSRALGAYPLKDQKVIVCEPDILSFQLNKNPPDFAILGTRHLLSFLQIHNFCHVI